MFDSTIPNILIGIAFGLSVIGFILFGSGLKDILKERKRIASIKDGSES